MTTDKIQLSNLTEEALFDLLKCSYLPDMVTTTRYAFNDAYSHIFDLYIELKCRRTHYDKLLVERLKWNKLTILPSVLYINSTPKGIYSFRLKEMEEPRWYDRTMPFETDFERKQKVIKSVGYLPISQAVDITRLLVKSI